MKCPECGRAVKFQKSRIACAVCGWAPSTTVQDMYRLAPLTDRRIYLGTVSLLISAGWYLFMFGTIVPSLALCACAIALVPITFAVRTHMVKKMMAECDWAKPTAPSGGSSR